MKFVIFRHLPDDGYESAFETLNMNAGKVVKEMVIPGMLGHQDIYIRHTNFWHRGETVLLITYTNAEPTGEEIDIVISEAIKMLDVRD